MSDNLTKRLTEDASGTSLYICWTERRSHMTGYGKSVNCALWTSDGSGLLGALQYVEKMHSDPTQADADVVSAFSKAEAIARFHPYTESKKLREYMSKRLDFASFASMLSEYPDDRLIGALKDIIRVLPNADLMDRERAGQGSAQDFASEGGFYRDQASCVRAEMKRRGLSFEM